MLAKFTRIMAEVRVETRGQEGLEPPGRNKKSNRIKKNVALYVLSTLLWKTSSQATFFTNYGRFVVFRLLARGSSEHARHDTFNK